MRKAGKRTKGPKPFTKEDRQQFKQVLEQELKDDPAVTIIEETAGSFIFSKTIIKIFSGNGDDGHKGYTIAKDTHLMNKAALLGTCND